MGLALAVLMQGTFQSVSEAENDQGAIERLVSQIYSAAGKNNNADGDFSEDAAKVFVLGRGLDEYEPGLRRLGFVRSDDVFKA